MLDAALDLSCCQFHRASRGLRPAGDAGFHPVPREIAVDGFVIKVFGGLGVDGVRPRPTSEDADQHDVEELRQLVDTGLADGSGQRGSRAVIWCTSPLALASGVLGVYSERNL